MDRKTRKLVLRLVVKHQTDTIKNRFMRMNIFALLTVMRMRYQEHVSLMWRYFHRLYPARRAWRLERSHEEFEQNYLRLQPDLGYWQENFRMRRESFEYLVNLCEPFMQKQDTRYRLAIPTPKRIAVALSWLANGGSLRHAGSSFGVPRSTAHTIVNEKIHTTT